MARFFVEYSYYRFCKQSILRAKVKESLGFLCVSFQVRSHEHLTLQRQLVWLPFLFLDSSAVLCIVHDEDPPKHPFSRRKRVLNRVPFWTRHKVLLKYRETRKAAAQIAVGGARYSRKRT